MQSGPEDSSQGAVHRACSFSLAAYALERAGKRLPAVLRLWANPKTIPGEARLALNRLPTHCSRHYYLGRVLGYTKHIPSVCCVGNVFDATRLNGVDTR